VTNHNEERTDFYTVKYASFGALPPSRPKLLNLLLLGKPAMSSMSAAAQGVLRWRCDFFVAIYLAGSDGSLALTRT